MGTMSLMVSNQIRVFGYNLQDMSQLLREFEKCGYIAETKTSPGNYMFIRYYSQLEVEKALALHDTVIAGHYIGVVRCTSEEAGKATESYLNQVHTQPLDTRFVNISLFICREYMLKENALYKKAPVKRVSLCSWLTELFFGVFYVCKQ